MNNMRNEKGLPSIKSGFANKNTHAHFGYVGSICFFVINNSYKTELVL